MAAKSMNQEQSLVFFQSQKISTADAQSAFWFVGEHECVPVASPQDAVRRTAQELVRTLSLKTYSPVKFFSLSGDASGKVGIEVRQFVKGASRNDLPFMFSLGVVEEEDIQNGVVVSTKRSVVLRDVDITNENMRPIFEDRCAYSDGIKTDYSGKSVKDRKQLFVDDANKLFDGECNYITANQLTHCIQHLIRKHKGFRVVSEGGNWYMPSAGMNDYRIVASKLAKSGVKLHEINFDPVVNDGLMQHVATSLEEQTEQLVADIKQHYAELQANGKSSRANGRETTLRKLVEANDRLEANKALVKDRIFKSLTKSLKAVEQAIGEEAFDVL